MDWQIIEGRSPLHRQSVLIVLFVIAGCATLAVWMLTSTGVSSTLTVDTYVEHASAVGLDNLRGNCPECGVVSSMRSIAHAAEGLNSGIEVTVRMRDGSSRQFADTSSANWRVGDRMIIIGSATLVGE
jgi:hypothetical protein